MVTEYQVSFGHNTITGIKWCPNDGGELVSVTWGPSVPSEMLGPE